MSSGTSGLQTSDAIRRLGLPDDAFEQKRPSKGLITKAEVRAVSLYNMGLFRDAVVWDVGAGTGSVAIEAARIAFEGRVYAIERDAESLEMLSRNVERLGARGVEIVRGEAPQALEALPSPDCVFIGGSGGRLPDILGYAASRLPRNGRIVVNLAAIERAVEAQSLLRTHGLEAQTTIVNVSRGKALPDGSTRFEALNPVFVVAGSRAGVA